MEYLSWLFFCVSPVALFCSEDGNGLILCPVFVILGFICKWAANQSKKKPRAIIKVEPQKYWEHMYKDAMISTFEQKDSISDVLMAHRDEEAREWATTLCRYHNVWIPPEEIQEQIARSNGVITKQMKKENDETKNRIQIGKYFLMGELKQKYDGKRFTDCSSRLGGTIWCHRIIDYDRNNNLHFSSSYGTNISEYSVLSRYDITPKQMWNKLTEQEKKQVEEWTEKYEKKLLEQGDAYTKGGHWFFSVDIEY